MFVVAALLLIAAQTIPPRDLSDAEINAAVARLSAAPKVQVFDPTLQATPARPSSSQGSSRPSLYDYIYCVQDAADRLDSSGEPATVVVDAASNECAHLQRGPAAPGSVMASLPDAKYQEIQGEFRAMVAANVRRRLVGVRACRNTPGCNLASVPPAFDDLPPRGQ